MDADESKEPRVQWLTKPALRLHVTLLCGVALCSAAAWFELSRALSGHHEVAWVYVFEWPLFGIIGTYLWWRLIHAEVDDHRAKQLLKEHPDPDLSAPLPTDSRHTVHPDDPDLIAWQRYLRALHTAEPPGAVPPDGQ